MSKMSILRYIGILLVVISFYFVVGVFWDNRMPILEWEPGVFDILLFIVCTLIYSTSQFFLSSAWSQLLEFSGQNKVDMQACHKVYGQTQIAKYIPGNIFHYAGRHTLGRQLGYSHFALMGATFYESLCLLLAASALSVIGIGAFGLDQLTFSSMYLLIVLILSIAILSTATISMPYLVKRTGSNLPIKSTREIFTRLKIVFLKYITFFLISGTLLVLVVTSLSHNISLDRVGIIIVISVASWLVGFITPGAPAGVGIREALIILALTQLFGASLAVIAALIYRMITVAGDIIFFFNTRLLPLWYKD